MTFGQILKNMREKRLWTQADLAAKSGVHRVQIAKIETGKAPSPSWWTVQRLAAALGVDCTAFQDQPTTAG